MAGRGAAAIDYNEDSDPEEFAEPEPLTAYTLCDALGVSRDFIKRLPAVDDRERGEVAAKSKPMQRMVQLLRRMTASVAEVVYPGDSADLLQAAGFDCHLGKKAERRRLRPESAAAQRAGARVVSAAVQVARRAPQRSFERRTARGILRAALPRSELAELDARQQRGPGQQLVGLSRSGKAYAQSLRDYETLTVEGHRLKRATAAALRVTLKDLPSIPE